MWSAALLPSESDGHVTSNIQTTYLYDNWVVNCLILKEKESWQHSNNSQYYHEGIAAAGFNKPISYKCMNYNIITLYHSIPAAACFDDPFSEQKNVRNMQFTMEWY